MTMLPTELIYDEILPRLPAESLTCFKSVSKSFDALISSPEFIKLQLRHSLSSSSKSFLIFDGQDDCLRCLDIDSIGSNPTMRLPFLELHRFDTSLFLLSQYQQLSRDDRVVLVGSCNGLLLIKRLSKYNSIELTVLNPCTRVYANLPPVEVRNLVRKSISFGFGYDSVQDDYKVVVFVGLNSVHIYSLKTKSWQNIVFQTTNNSVKMCNRTSALIDNHILHIICRDDAAEHDNFSIKCFDVCEECWIKGVPLPDYNDEEFDVADVGVLDGCLTLLTLKEGESYLDVWVMKEYGVKESWVKLLGDLDSCVTKYLGNATLAYCGESRSQIFLSRIFDTTAQKLVLYSIRNRGHEPTEISDVDGAICFNESIVFTGTLVNIPDGRKLNRGQLTSLILKYLKRDSRRRVV